MSAWDSSLIDSRNVVLEFLLLGPEDRRRAISIIKKGKGREGKKRKEKKGGAEAENSGKAVSPSLA